MRYPLGHNHYCTFHELLAVVHRWYTGTYLEVMEVLDDYRQQMKMVYPCEGLKN